VRGSPTPIPNARRSGQPGQTQRRFVAATALNHHDTGQCTIMNQGFVSKSRRGSKIKPSPMKNTARTFHETAKSTHQFGCVHRLPLKINPGRERAHAGGKPTA